MAVMGEGEVVGWVWACVVDGRETASIKADTHGRDARATVGYLGGMGFSGGGEELGLEVTAGGVGGVEGRGFAGGGALEDGEEGGEDEERGEGGADEAAD